MHNMETMDVNDEPQARLGLLNRLMSMINSKVKGLSNTFSLFDEKVSSSTFGRIFKLGGSGHVSS